MFNFKSPIARRSTLNQLSVNNTVIHKQSSIERTNKKNANMDYISNKGLEDIYDKFSKVQQSNKVKYNTFMEDINNDYKEEMKTMLMRQERVLDKRVKNVKTNSILSKQIADKVKKDSEELLMNRTDAFRAKKELKQIVEKKQPLHSRYGNHNWMVSLRRPDKFVGDRYATINIGKDLDPVWVTVKESYPDYIERIEDPDKTTKVSDLSEYMTQTMQTLRISTEKVTHTSGLIVSTEMTIYCCR